MPDMNNSARGPLWVTSRHGAAFNPRPLLPQKQTSIGALSMSVKCHKRTHALQQLRLRSGSSPSLHLDNLDPVRALAHRIARWIAELSTCLVDPINRKPIRFLPGGDKILPARIDIDATRLSFGSKISHVSELARV